MELNQMEEARADLEIQLLAAMDKRAALKQEMTRLRAKHDDLAQTIDATRRYGRPVRIVSAEGISSEEAVGQPGS